MAGLCQDTGCFVEGHLGQYAVAAMVAGIAEPSGYANRRIISLARRHLATMGYSDRAGPITRPLDDDEVWELDDAADDVTDWLTENVAARGYSFGWHEGELFLFSDAEWDEVYS